MRPRCSILTGGFDFSGCEDCSSCSPLTQGELSNSKPSAIMLQRILCMRDYTIFDSNGENGSLNVGARHESERCPETPANRENPRDFYFALTTEPRPSGSVSIGVRACDLPDHLCLLWLPLARQCNRFSRSRP